MKFKRSIKTIISIVIVGSTGFLSVYFGIYAPGQHERKFGELAPYYHPSLPSHFEELEYFDPTLSNITAARISFTPPIPESIYGINFEVNQDIMYFQILCYLKYLPDEASPHYNITSNSTDIQVKMRLIPHISNSTTYCTCIWAYLIEGWIVGISNEIASIHFLSEDSFGFDFNITKSSNAWGNSMWIWENPPIEDD